MAAKGFRHWGRPGKRKTPNDWFFHKETAMLFTAFSTSAVNILYLVEEERL